MPCGYFSRTPVSKPLLASKSYCSYSGAQRTAAPSPASESPILLRDLAVGLVHHFFLPPYNLQFERSSLFKFLSLSFVHVRTLILFPVPPLLCQIGALRAFLVPFALVSNFEFRAVNWGEARRVDTTSDLKVGSQQLNQLKVATCALREALWRKEDDAHVIGRQ